MSSRGRRVSTHHADFLWLLLDDGGMAAFRVDCSDDSEKVLLQHLAGIATAGMYPPSPADAENSPVRFNARLRIRRLDTMPVCPGEPMLESLFWEFRGEQQILQFFDQPDVGELLGNSEGFRSRLDTEALSFLGDLAVEHGGYFQTVGNYSLISGVRQELRRNRMQAARAFPNLVARELFHSHVFWGQGDEEPELHRPDSFVLEAIDSGSSLVPVLARRHGVQKNTIRYWTALSASIPDHACQTLLCLADGMPPEKRPMTPDDFEAGRCFFEWLNHWGYWAGDEQCRAVLRSLGARAFRKGFPAALARLRKCYPEQADPLGDANHFLWEQFDDYSAFLLGNGLSLDQWLIEHGLWALLDASDRWHKHIAREQSDDQQEDREWQPICPEPLDFGMRIAMELSSVRALAEEGVALDHCVATVSRRCGGSGSRIFSLRDRAGNRKSTLQVNLCPGIGGACFVSAEHKARRNAPPEAECAIAARLLLDRLNRHHLPG
jgi:hypothetical protein